MDNKIIIKQIIQYNKTAFDSSLNSMKMVYEQNEKMLNTFLDQEPLGCLKKVRKSLKIGFQPTVPVQKMLKNRSMKIIPKLKCISITSRHHDLM